MAKELTYINGENTYVLEEDGGTNPDIQSLTLGSVVEDAAINHLIPLSENKPKEKMYLKYGSLTHNYYCKDEGAYVVEEGDEAIGLPQYLVGWKLSDNTPFTGTGNTVDQSFITQWFEEGNANMDLYGIWGNTRFIRVIVSSYDNYDHSNDSYRVIINEQSSYDESSQYPLSPEFKNTVDYRNNYEHMTLKLDGFSENYTEVGYGDGCPTYVDGQRYVSYFGVKDNTSPTLRIETNSSQYLPYYVTYPEFGYEAFVCQQGLSRDLYTKTESVALTKISGENVWTCSLGTINSDKTVFIRLTRKPKVTATVLDTETGKVAMTYNNTPPPSSAYSNEVEQVFMPNTTCVLWAQPSPGYSFDGWYIGSYRESSSTPYVISNVTETAVHEARFITNSYTITYYKQNV